MFDNVWLGYQSCIKPPVNEACIPISGGTIYFNVYKEWCKEKGVVDAYSVHYTFHSEHPATPSCLTFNAYMPAFD